MSVDNLRISKRVTLMQCACCGSPTGLKVHRRDVVRSYVFELNIADFDALAPHVVFAIDMPGSHVGKDYLPIVWLLACQ